MREYSMYFFLCPIGRFFCIFLHTNWMNVNIHIAVKTKYKNLKKKHTQRNWIGLSYHLCFMYNHRKFEMFILHIWFGWCWYIKKKRNAKADSFITLYFICMQIKLNTFWNWNDGRQPYESELIHIFLVYMRKILTEMNRQIEGIINDERQQT